MNAATHIYVKCILIHFEEKKENRKHPTTITTTSTQPVTKETKHSNSTLQRWRADLLKQHCTCIWASLKSVAKEATQERKKIYAMLYILLTYPSSICLVIWQILFKGLPREVTLLYSICFGQIKLTTIHGHIRFIIICKCHWLYPQGFRFQIAFTFLFCKLSKYFT